VSEPKPFLDDPEMTRCREKWLEAMAEFHKQIEEGIIIPENMGDKWHEIIGSASRRYFAYQDLLLSGVRLIPRESKFKPNSNT